jgi:hypothetical protein
MGCGGSKQTVDHRREAERYNRRKQNGFKDSGLEKQRKDCIKQKKGLKHVEDPAIARKKKLQNIKAKNKVESKAPGGFAQNDILNAKKNLKTTRKQ